MQRFETTLEWEPASMANCFAFLPEKPEQLCYFDIETNGLSPDISSLYLIGAAVWDGTRFALIQWFADDYISEKDLLLSFAEFASPFAAFVHYNGSSFDIPFLEKKYAAHKLRSPFTDKKSIDIFRELPGDRHFFPVENRRLATMEKLLSFQRKDRFTGKDCISLYTEFMQKKYFRDETAEDCKKKLLLHNLDDLQGTILCGQLLAYRHAFPEACTARLACSGRPENEPAAVDAGQTPDTHPHLILGGQLADGYFPLPVQTARNTADSENAALLTFRDGAVSVDIPLCDGEYYHYFSDYKNYYYLIKEDMAVHKSVGLYVDRQYRRQATARDCYIKKSGLFLPLPANAGKEPFEPGGRELPLFRKNYKSRRLFLDTDTIGKLPGDSLSHLLRAYL